MSGRRGRFLTSGRGEARLIDVAARGMGIDHSIGIIEMARKLHAGVALQSKVPPSLDLADVSANPPSGHHVRGTNRG